MSSSQFIKGRAAQRMKDIREIPQDQLLKHVEVLREQLFVARRNAKTQTQRNPFEIRALRKSIARTLTHFNTLAKQAARDKYKDLPLKKMPKELRPRMTKKARLALTEKQENAVRPKTLKLRQRYAERNYAVLRD